MSTPSKKISPSSSGSSRFAHRNSVDLPDPEAPIRVMTSPSATSRSIPSSTVLVPKDLRTLRNDSFGVLEMLEMLEVMTLQSRRFDGARG